MNIISYFSPFRLQLCIFQLEGYNLARFLKWIRNNFFTRKLSNKKGLVITTKIKLLESLSIFSLFMFISLFWFFTKEILLTTILSIVLITQPYFLLISAQLLLTPYEFVNRLLTIKKTRKKILSFTNMKVIAITGSYGKTSTKEILYQILKNKYKTLKTPESYNTLFGIAKVVKLELDDSYEYFICEMGAFRTGEIKALCQMIPPTYGLLTGITSQHLERFGSMKNTISAKFELPDSIKNTNNILYNLDDINISSELLNRQVITSTGYGLENEKSIVKASSVNLNNRGSSFELEFQKIRLAVKCPLFGLSNVKNVLAASTMAYILGLDPEYITKQISKLNPFPNRNQLKIFASSTIVDNTYSTNEEGFKETIKTAQLLTGKKALVTPGIVELGSQETSIHQLLGELSSGVFDKIVLVGKNNRTKSFAGGVINKKSIEYIDDNRQNYKTSVEQLLKKYDWIFLENDLTQNY